MIVDRDANLGALLDYDSGAAQGVRSMAFIYPGDTAIGAGLAMNGSSCRGDVGSAVEIDQLTI